jgi:cell division protein FtsB
VCEPITTIAMMGLSGASTLLGAQQQAQQAAAQQSLRAYQASYQTAVARNAALAAEYNAQDAERRGAVEEERQRRKTALLLGAQQARLAAQGGDLAGSPLDILGDTAAMGEEDALLTRYQAAREAWAQRIQAASQNAQADFLTRSATMPTGADPGLGIARSLLGGGTDLFRIADQRGWLPKTGTTAARTRTTAPPQVS